MSTKTRRVTYGGGVYEKEDVSAGHEDELSSQEEYEYEDSDDAIPLITSSKVDVIGDLWRQFESSRPPPPPQPQSQSVISTTTKKSKTKSRRLAAQRSTLAAAEEDARILAEMYDDAFATEEVPLPQPSPLQVPRKRRAAFETPQVVVPPTSSVPSSSSKKHRSSSGFGIATGVHSTFTYDNDVDERPISRIMGATTSPSATELTSPSSIADLILTMSGPRCLKTFIGRKYWEIEESGRARSFIALLESGDYDDSAQREKLLRKGYFIDPLSEQLVKVCAALPCTASNAEMISSYLIFKASNEVSITGVEPYNKANLTLDVFGMPPIQTSLHYSFQSSGVDGYEPCQIGYIENMDKLHKCVDIQRAAVMAIDSRAYFASKVASLRDLGAMWCKAEMILPTLGRDPTPSTTTMQTSPPTAGGGVGAGAGASSRRGPQ